MVFVKINSHSITLVNTTLTKLKISLEINQSQITNLKNCRSRLQIRTSIQHEVSRDLQSRLLY